MNVLIVHAHYELQSFNTALKDVAVSELGALGHNVQVSDLYAMNWNPVTSAADFGSRANPDYLVYALEQRHNHANNTLAPDILAEFEKLMWADLVIFNFPIYWWSVPAILKGWFDRVFLSGPVYGGKRIYDRGGLVGKKTMLTVTMGARQHMLIEGSIHGPLEDMLRPIMRGTLAYVGMSVLPPFVGYHVPYITQEERVSIVAEYRQRLQTLENLQPLKFVTLDQFDDKLRPIAG
ncbi:MAG: NAD(P)H-dependent oxidoreductase [Sterolibacterium sp.]